MVYFYSKLIRGIYQIKIDNFKGQNIEIKINSYSFSYLIDFGFDG